MIEFKMGPIKIIEKYNEGKESGKCSLVKTDKEDIKILRVKKFDPETGEPINDDSLDFSINSFKELKKRYESEIALVEEFLKECDVIK